jgi:hypothetical protein
MPNEDDHIRRFASSAIARPDTAMYVRQIEPSLLRGYPAASDVYLSG